MMDDGIIANTLGNYRLRGISLEWNENGIESNLIKIYIYIYDNRKNDQYKVNIFYIIIAIRIIKSILKLQSLFL